MTQLSEREVRVSSTAIGLVIARRRRPMRYVTLGLSLVLVAMFISLILRNDQWQWPVVGEYLFAPLVLKGLLNTVALTVVAGVVGIVLGLGVAFMRMSDDPTLRAVGAAYVWVVRAIPALVLLLAIYFLAVLLPRLSLGVPFGPELFTFNTNQVITHFGAAVLGLSLITGAYTAEIFRAAISAVDSGQVEAAEALGMNPLVVFHRVVLPQALRICVPPVFNEIITLFKGTALVSVIGYTELLTTVQTIYSATYQTVPLLMTACIWYLTLTSIAMLVQQLLERRLGRGYSTSTKNTSSTVRQGGVAHEH